MARLPLAEWEPRQQLRLPVTDIPRAAFPVIDVHNHLGRWLFGGEVSVHFRWTEAGDRGWVVEDVAQLVRMMDEKNIEAIVNLDGMWGEEVTANLEHFDRAYPGRFFTFCQLDWPLLAEDDGEELLLASLRDSAGRGARGLKVWKNLGLTVRDASGDLVLPDDPRVIRLLRAAGELGLPVLIHTADPRAFFDPIDRHNERIDELLHEREWWFGDQATYPTFERLLAALRTLVISAPGTTFIAAHAAAAEHLDWVESLMADADNFYADIASRIGELGRQPRRFRRLLDRFPDRVLFGTDNFPPDDKEFELHFRFLETADEAFPYAAGLPIPPQGRWTVSGMDLSGDLLAAVYSGNARRVLGLSSNPRSEAVQR